MTQKPSHSLRSLSILCLLLSLFALPLGVSAQTATQFCITQVDASQFPRVQLKLRAIDLNNQVVSTLNNTNVAVYENGEQAPQVEVTRQDEGPVNYIFLIDLGRLANYTTIFGLNNSRTMLLKLVEGGYFKEGIDQVMVLGRKNTDSDKTEVLLPATQNPGDFTRFVGNFNFARGSGPTKGLLGVDEAIDQMATLAQTPGTETAVIIYITRWVEEPTRQTAITAAQQVAANAKAKNILVYVFQTDSSGFNKEPLQELATGAYGTYQTLKGSTVVTNVTNVYQFVNSQRAIYDVAYNSPVGTSGARQLSINAPQHTGACPPGKYEATVQPPTVTLTEPAADSTITRNPAGANDRTQVTVTGEITWGGEQNPRKIKSIELLANGASQGKQTPGDAATQFEFQWDISDITEVGSNPVKLEVKVIDELDLESAAAVNVTVEIPPAPTPTATQFTLIPTPPTDLPISTLGLVISVVCLGLLCAVPFAFLIFYLTRPVQAKKAIADIRHTLIGGAPAKQKSLATLQVLEGPKGMIGERLDITKPITTLGRNPKVVDMVFYADEESSVSRLHATIQLDGKTFKLTDNNSTSGTRLNGRRLQPNDPTELHDGDEIVLGDLGKLGVKLKFGFLMDKTQLQSSGTASDRTFIIDDFDKDEWDKYKDN